MREYQVISAPAGEPVLLADMKTHLRVDATYTADDLYIEGLITACRTHLERQYEVAMITQTLQLNLDYFPWWWLFRGSMNSMWWWQDQAYYAQILLRGPVQSIVSVSYLDVNDNPQTLSSSLYKLDAYSMPARLVPARNQIWPATAYDINAIQVQFVAGYGAADTSVPADMRAALKMLVGHFYENREEVQTGTRLVAIQMPIGVDALMRPYAMNTGYLVA